MVDALNNWRKQAAIEAMKSVRSGMILGLGTGRTVRFFLTMVAKAIAEGMALWGVPTSYETARLSRRLQIPLLEDASHIDMAVDGADAVDRAYRLIKGGGGALTREKIVASQAQRLVIIVDEQKCVPSLCGHWLPLEVLPFRHDGICCHLQEALGGDVCIVQRRDQEGSPLMSDNGNLLWDLRLPKMEPSVVAQRIDSIAGIVAHGLFLDMADCVIVSGERGVRRWNPPP